MKKLIIAVIAGGALFVCGPAIAQPMPGHIDGATVPVPEVSVGRCPTCYFGPTPVPSPTVGPRAHVTTPTALPQTTVTRVTSKRLSLGLTFWYRP